MPKLPYEKVQIAGNSLTDKTNLIVLFDKTNINDINERFGYSEPSLFIFYSSTSFSRQ